HAQVRSDQIDVELHPDGRADERPHRETDASRSVDYRKGGAYLEPEPVPDVLVSCLTQLRFGNLACRLAVHVDVEAATHADVARQQSRRALDDPGVVDEIQPFQQAVV